MADDDTLLNQYVSNNHESTRLSQVEPVQINNNTVKGIVLDVEKFIFII